MKIYYEVNVEEVRKIIIAKAIYQKVLLIYDETTSKTEIDEIYEQIKDICIYNRQNIHTLDMNEVYNGYRLLIFYCSAENFLKNSFDRSEFVNIYCVKDRWFLPYFLSVKNELLLNDKNYLMIENKDVDISIIASLNFNMFYNYLLNLINGEDYYKFSYSPKEITQQNIISYLNNLNSNMIFLDIDILKQQGMNYKDLFIIDIMILDAMILFFESIKNNEVMMVDVYKASKIDFDKIDKFYKFSKNVNLLNLIILNYNCLYNYCLKTKENVLELMKLCDVDYLNIDELFEKLKLYSKNDNDVMGYMYFYNIFGV